MVPGIASPAATSKLEANAGLVGIFKKRINNGPNKTPPLLASNPDRKPTERATVAIFQTGILFNPSNSGGEVMRKKETPNDSTKMSVRIINMSPPSQSLKKDPMNVAGIPSKMLVITTLLLIRFSLLYATEAERVVGKVAGRGEAKAANGLIPANICKAGVVMALPPLPSKPERNPTTPPMTRMMAFG